MSLQGRGAIRALFAARHRAASDCFPCGAPRAADLSATNNLMNLKLAFMAGAAALALSAGAAAAAGQETCLDRYCEKISIFGIAADAQSAASAQGGSTEAHRFGTWGFDVSGMDRSVKPGDNFYRYAVGKSIDNMVLPSDRARYGSFDQLRELSDTRVHALIEGMKTRTDLKPGSDEGKIGPLYGPLVRRLRDQPVRRLRHRRRQGPQQERALPGSERPGSAGSRLLSEGRLQGEAGGLQGLCRLDPAPDRLGERRRRGRLDRGLRNQAGRGAVEPGRGPRRGQD